MRVAIEARGLSIPGGARRYIRNLVEALARVDQANEYWLIKALSDGAGEHLPSKMRSLVMPGCSKLTQIAWDQVRLPLTLRRLECQVIHATKNVGPLNTSAKLVVTVLDMIPFLFPESMPSLDAIYWRKMIPRVLRKAEAVIAISEVTKRDIANLSGIDPKKIRVIPLGVEKTFRPIEDRSLKMFRKHKGIDFPFLLYVGALEPRKNASLLIDSFSQFKRATRSPHKLVLVGKSGWYDRRIDTALARCPFEDEIIFPGFVAEEELPYYYNLADALVYPSEYEGFGIPVLEAMACGTPVIAAEAGALPEVLDGAGILVPADEEPLTAAMTEIVSNETMRARLRIRGIERAKQFPWEKTATLTKQLYEELGTN